MKKFLFIFMACSLLFVCQPHVTVASEPPLQQTTSICHSNDLIIETTLTIYNPNALTRVTQSKSAQKEVAIKNAAGRKLAAFTLYGSFTYNGSSATCTNASKSTSITDNTWHFSSSRAWTNGNCAQGYYSLNCSATMQSLSNNVTLTCSPNGTIS